MRALIFDVDGTLAETELSHLAAFNATFSAHGLPFHWNAELYMRLLKVSGGKERIRAYWQSTDVHQEGPHGGTLDDFIALLHAYKTRLYVEDVGSGKVPLRAGIIALIEAAEAKGLKLAIATMTTPENIDALLTPTLGRSWRKRFAVIGDGYGAPVKKPDPQVYDLVVSRLALPVEACLAIEDSHNGLVAARAAGLECVVTPSRFTGEDNFDGALQVLPNLGETSLEEMTKIFEARIAARIREDIA
ncbi:MAG: HAD-IA family hydrolase [Alphaproteobacteria bacterium]|nr:HAD-IA family hydrolase [Alphaproteobacteria bacterium]MDE2042731.1 HAD-IA family hydrolase [Alphaproteobacteria bacterium]